MQVFNELTVRNTKGPVTAQQAQQEPMNLDELICRSLWQIDSVELR